MIPHLLLTLLVLLVALAVVTRTDGARKPVHWVAGKGDQGWQWKYRVWMPAHWVRLAQCESGGRPEPNWQHDSGTYTGGFGFYIGSWQRFKPVASWPARASQASPWQQYRTALRIHAIYGFSGWGCWHGEQHAWVRDGR